MATNVEKTVRRTVDIEGKRYTVALDRHGLWMRAAKSRAWNWMGWAVVVESCESATAITRATPTGATKPESGAPRAKRTERLELGSEGPTQAEAIEGRRAAIAAGVSMPGVRADGQYESDALALADAAGSAERDPIPDVASAERAWGPCPTPAPESPTIEPPASGEGAPSAARHTRRSKCKRCGEFGDGYGRKGTTHPRATPTTESGEVCS